MLLSVRLEEETVFLRLVALDELGSEDKLGFVKSQNTADEAEELSLLLLNLRLFAELSGCVSKLL